MKKTRILIVVPSNKGTIAMCSLNLWRAFRMNSSVEVKCVLAYRLEDGLPEFEDCQYLLSGIRHGFGRVKAVAIQLRELRRFKIEFKPDMTISTLNSCNVLNILSGGCGKKVGILHSPHFQMKSKGRFAYFLSNLEIWLLYRYLDHIACVSREVMNTTANSFPNLPYGKFCVIHNIHFTDRIRSLSTESLDTSEEESFFNGKVLLYCGRMDENKAPDRLARAFSLSGLRDYRIVFLGPDEGMLAGILDFAREHNFDDRVLYVGSKDNPYKYMARSKALVSCSYSEGLPGAVIESLSLGIPVVSTNSTYGIWEIFGCEKDYDSALSSNLAVDSGIITPITGDGAYDDARLAEALALLPDRKWHPSLALEGKMTPSYVTGQFLDLL